MGAYEDAIAKIGATGAHVTTNDQRSANAAPSTYAQYGYTAPQIQAPGPSIGNKVSSFFRAFDPTSERGQHNFLNAGHAVLDIAGNTVENANKFSKFAMDQNPLNPMFTYNHVKSYLEANTIHERATQTINNANQQYASGSMNKEQRDEVVKQANQDIKRATINVISKDAPMNLQETLDLIDGAVTVGSLGAYTAAKMGVLEGGKLAIKGTSDFVLNRMVAASEVAGTKGVSTEVGNRIIANAAPTTAERMMMTAEQAIYNTPALARNYDRILREIGTSANAKGYAKNVLVQIGFTSPLRRETMRMTADMVEQAREGNYFTDGTKMGAVPQALLLAGMALEGGPVGFVLKNTRKAGKALHTAMYGETAFIDSLNTALVNHGVKGNIIEGINAYLKRAPKETQKEAKAILQQFVGTNLQRGAADKTADAVAQYIVKTADDAGIDIATMKMDDIVEQIMVHTQMQNLLQDLNRKGLNVVAAKYDVGTQKQLQKLISQAIAGARKDIAKFATHEERMAMRKDIAKKVVQAQIAKNPYWAQNQDVVNAIFKQIDGATSTKYLVGAPGAVQAGYRAKGVPRDIAKKLKDNGYLPVTTESQSYIPQISREEAKNVALKSKYVEVNDKLFEQAAISKPFFRQMGSALTKVGLGLDESASVAYRLVRDNASQLIQKETGQDGRKVLNALQQWAETGTNSRFADFAPGNWRDISKRVTTDLRMMYTRQVKEALADAGIKVTDKEAKAIQKAILDAHTAVPMQVLGLADTLVANAYKHVPFYKLYAKAQGAFRYTYNPFFNVQEQFETEILGQALAPGKQPYIAGFGRLVPGGKARLDATVKQLESAGFFNNSTLVSNDINKSLMATRFGEGAQDVYLGRVSAHITDSQKRSLAAAVVKIADKMGLTTEEALARHGAMIEDLVRPIVQYPTHGALNSNLVKAMNLAVFPSRYNLKVTALAVKALGQTRPAMQTLVINKLWEMENWLKTPEGIAWQQEHNAAISLFKWLTPVGNIQWVFDVLSAPGGKSNVSSVGDLGIIGGLPFGVIGQILQNQGLFSMNTPYVSPKDGSIYAKKIPESMKARVSMALMDLIGSTFSYPGATIGLNQLGLPSKTQLLKSGASAVSLDTKYNEWQTKQYTPVDLSYADRVKQEIWAEQYDIKHGIKKPEVSVAPKPATSPLQPGVTGGPVMTKVELANLKKAAKDAKAAAKKKSKTTTFPSRLPQ